MSVKQGPKALPTEKVQASYKKLSLAAKSLNTASDEMGKAISILDAALQKLNLGVSAWVLLSGNENQETNDWWSRSLGYARIGDRWGIALRKAEGNFAFPEADSVESWLFNEGPRWMRTEAVGKIPELLVALQKQAEDTTKQITEKTAQVYELAAAMSDAGEEAQFAEEKTHARPA